MKEQEHALPATVNAEFVATIEAEARHLEPQPLEHDRPIAQGFPVHALPDGLQWMAENLRDTIGFPIDYTASAMLFSASVAVGTSMGITPKEGWIEPATLWLALVGRPGANKTHPLTMMLKPLNARDHESAKRYAEELKQYQAEVKLARKEEGRETPAEPECAQHLVGDITPEALAEVLGKNPRGVGVYRDELAGWINDFGRYSGGGEVQAYLSMWSAQALRVNRVKSRKPLFVERPFVSVCGTIQPGVLGGLVADGRGANGFIDRILFAYPEAQEMAAWSMVEPDPQCGTYWDSVIARLLSIPPPDEGTDPVLLRFTPDAMEQWTGYHARMKAEIDRLNADGDEARAGHRTKMLSYTLRLALVHTMLQWATSNDFDIPKEVEVPSLTAAITLADYFTSTADKVLYTLNESTPVDRLTGDQLRLFDALPNEFRTAEAVIKAEGLRYSVRTAKRLLNRWAKDGLVKREGQGRYSKRFEH